MKKNSPSAFPIVWRGVMFMDLLIMPCVHAFFLEIRLLYGFDVRLEQFFDMQKVRLSHISVR